MEIDTKRISAARQLTIGDIPRRSARRFPSKVAIVNEGRSFTFAEFEDAVERTSRAIIDAGLRKGDRIALLSHNCWQFAVLNFATARSGTILVPINFMLKPGEIAYILDDCTPDALIVESALIDTAESAMAAAQSTVPHRLFIGLEGRSAAHAGWTSVSQWIDFRGVAQPTVVVEDDDAVRLMYTSGTESQPKGAILSSRSLIAEYVSCIVDGKMSAEDVEVHALPLYHCAQLDCFLSVDIYLGATSVILRSPDPGAVLAAIAEHQATKFFAPPTVWISLLRAPEFEHADLSTLCKGYYGASPMPVEVLREIGNRLPDVRLWNLYGQTELGPVVAILQPEDQVRRAGAAGRPVLNVETLIVDDTGQPVPAGVVGEIVHRSPQATSGYYGKPEKTNEAFSNGWFHSGDLGVFDEEGYLTVVDRKKDMIKTGGENVASREVEEAIYQLDGVAEVAVFGVADPVWIEAVTAVVVAKQGATITPEDVIAHARKILAHFKAPKHVTMVGELPKNPSGKILKRILRDEHANPSASV
ncbi:fatty acyl-CoA synthetase [Rhodococcus erythropolis]